MQILGILHTYAQHCFNSYEHRLSHWVSCVLNRKNQHDGKRWALGFEGNERCMAWLLGRPEHALTAEERGNSFP